MGLRIASNILALRASNSLNQTSKAIARSLQRLSTGQRINSARDDIAGLSIASRLEAQQRGLLQSIRNVNDATAILGTADSALQSQLDIVQRMNELALQAASGTLGSADRTRLDGEFQELLSEFNRITSQTNFNGTNLLDGSFAATNIQVGPNKGNTIALSLTSMQQSLVFPDGSVSSSSIAGDGTFKARTTYAAGTLPSTACEGDLNGDGYLDLIYTDSGDRTASVRLGNGNGTFGTRTTYATGVDASYIITADVNKDGNLDMITSDTTDATVSIMLGNGNGTFATRRTSSATLGGSQIVTADLNGDGNLDIVQGRATSPELSILYGNGNGTFAARTILTTGNSNVGVNVADVNNDGKSDILVAESGNSPGYTGNTVSVFLGNGNGTFAARTSLATGVGAFGVTTADLNGDGNLDIVTADYTDSTVSILLGNGNGTFKTRATIKTGTGTEFANLVDINGDGSLDILTSDTVAGTVSILLGNGNGTFRTRTTLAAGTSPSGTVDAVDLNDDGALDLIVPDFGATSVSVWLANATTVTTTTDTALSLTTQIDAEGVLGVLSSAIDYINTARSNIGAIHNRLDFTSSYLSTTAENITNAKSSIMDADIALEVAELTRQQILQQAGVSVLAQANIQMQTALKLLDALNKK